MNTERFIENIMEQIKEAQLKLGFAKESIRLYFPLESLCDLLQIKCDNAETLYEKLETETALQNTVLGALNFSKKGNRFEVCISPKGAIYVNEKMPNPPFLVQIIQLFRENHDVTVQKICSCFEKFNKEYVCKKMEPNADFDYVLYFKNQKPDAWYYCVKEEMGHMIYHRFTKEDFLKL